MGLKRKLILLYKALRKGDFEILCIILLGAHSNRKTMVDDLLKRPLNTNITTFPNEGIGVNSRLVSKDRALQNAVFGISKSHLDCVKLLLVCGVSVQPCQLPNLIFGDCILIPWIRRNFLTEKACYFKLQGIA